MCLLKVILCDLMLLLIKHQNDTTGLVELSQSLWIGLLRGYVYVPLMSFIL